MKHPQISMKRSVSLESFDGSNIALMLSVEMHSTISDRRKVFLLDSRFSFLWAIRAPSRIFAEQPDGWMGSNFCLRHVGTYISFLANGLPILITARCFSAVKMQGLSPLTLREFRGLAPKLFFGGAGSPKSPDHR